MLKLEPETTYDAKVVSGSHLFESSAKGTLGFNLALETDSGIECFFPVWLTEANANRARDTFVNTLKVKEENLSNYSYIENQLSVDLVGKDVSFVTDEDDPKYGVKIKWLNGPRKVAGAWAAKQMAMLFGGPAVTREVPAGFKSDDEIPF